MWFTPFLLMFILCSTCRGAEPQASIVRPQSTFRDEDYSLSSEESRNVRILEAVTALWFLAIGTCVGSFLNVVVYRAPLGMDIVLPKSRCPKCQSAIQPRDNIPVIGWLRLRGKCRNCQAPISARYPAVELGIGLLLLVFMYRTLLSGGENLPVRDTYLYRGVIWILWYTKWDLLGIYLYEMCLLVILWGGVFMEYDGNRWPRSVVTFGTIVGLLGVTVWPHLHPVPMLGPSVARLPHQTGIGVLSGLAGIAAAVSASAAVSWTLNRLFMPVQAIEQETPPTSRQFVMTAGLIGLYLGWQTGLILTLFTGGLMFCHSRVRRFPVATMSVAVTVLLLVWRPVFDYVWSQIPSLSSLN